MEPRSRRSPLPLLASLSSVEPCFTACCPGFCRPHLSPTVARNARRSANASKPPSVVLGFTLPPARRSPRLQPLVPQHARPRSPCAVLLPRSSSVAPSSSSTSSRRCLASSASPECVARNVVASSLCCLEGAQPVQLAAHPL
ncbi:hypothetical protein VPH35_019193 [Triticum aestivum]